MTQKKRNNKKKIRKICVYIEAALLACIGIYILFSSYSYDNLKNKVDSLDITKAPASTEQTASTPKVTSTPKPQKETKKDKTKTVYTYLQGPKSWSERRDWSGYWSERYVNGGSFGGFGCGLCCLANIYSTITPYRCTPMQMYSYAKKVTYYRGGGAISWGHLQKVMTSLGMSTQIKRKPKSYETFQKQIASSECSLVLVSSNNSKCYWKNTPGHYVTIFMYNPENDKVFLADSGNPDNNRSWVSLKKIYRSLKTASQWQYINVKGFDKELCQWKHKNVSGEWVKPSYIK